MCRMNGILRNRVSSCTRLQHIRGVLYSSASPSLLHTPPVPSPTSSPTVQDPPQDETSNLTYDSQTPQLPNGALVLPHGLTMRKKSALVTYRGLNADQLLGVIYSRKKAGEPQELLNFIYLVMELRKTNNTQGIVDAIVLMKEVGVEPNMHIFNMLITYFGMQKDPFITKELIVRMRNRGFDLSDSNYNAPIQAFLTSDSDSFYQDAVETFQWAMNKGVALKTGTYFSLLSSAIKRDDDAVCQQILADMSKHGLEPPDSRDIFNMYITSRTLNRNYRGVLQKYDEMRSLDLFPTYPCFTQVFKSASMLHNAPKIHAVWQDLRSTMGPAPLLATNITQYNSYIRALALAGDTKGCFDAFELLRADGVKPVMRTYLPVLEALVRSNDAAGLARLLADAGSEGITIDGYMLQNAQHVIGGDALDEIRKRGKRPTVSAYNTQLAKFAKDGDHQALVRTAEEMTRDGVTYDVTTYNTLIAHAASTENNEEIRRLHLKMSSEGVHPDGPLYNILAQNYARMRDSPACTKLVDAMLRERVQLHTQAFQPLMSIILDNNDIERCLGMLDRMRSPKQEPFDVPTYNRIIDLLLSKGDIMGCNKLLAEMQTKGLKPSLHIYNSLIGVAVQRGDKNWISVLMNELATQDLRADMTTYTRVFEGIAQAGDAEACDVWVATMRTNGLSPNRAIYHHIINVKAMRGDAEACGRIVREMGVRGMSPEPQSYSVTIQLLVRKGDQLNCRTVYEEMKSRNVIPDRTTYNLVALISNTEDGLKLLNDMRNTAVTPDAETYRALLGSMAWRGDVDGCRRALVEMDRDRVVPDIATYNFLVSILGKHTDTRVLCNRLLEGIPPQGFAPYVSPESNPMPMYDMNNSTPIPPMQYSTMPPPYAQPVYNPFPPMNPTPSYPSLAPPAYPPMPTPSYPSLTAPPYLPILPTTPIRSYTPPSSPIAPLSPLAPPLSSSPSPSPSPSSPPLIKTIDTRGSKPKPNNNEKNKPILPSNENKRVNNNATSNFTPTSNITTSTQNITDNKKNNNNNNRPQNDNPNPAADTIHPSTENKTNTNKTTRPNSPIRPNTPTQPKTNSTFSTSNQNPITNNPTRQQNPNNKNNNNTNNSSNRPRSPSPARSTSPTLPTLPTLPPSPSRPNPPRSRNNAKTNLPNTNTPKTNNPTINNSNNTPVNITTSTTPIPVTLSENTASSAPPTPPTLSSTPLYPPLPDECEPITTTFSPPSPSLSLPSSPSPPSPLQPREPLIVINK